MKRLPPFLPHWAAIRPLLWVAFGVWIAALFYATCQPGSVFPWPALPYFDKILHFVFFACGAMSGGAALRATFHGSWPRLFLIVIVSLGIMGVADEINQLRIPGRSGGDPFDWLADLFGTVCGLALLRSFYAKKPRENPAPPSGDRAA